MTLIAACTSTHFQLMSHQDTGTSKPFPFVLLFVLAFFKFDCGEVHVDSRDIWIDQITINAIVASANQRSI